MNFTETIKELNDKTNREGEKWFQAKRKVYLPAVFLNVFSQFMKTYFLKGEWRRGYTGFMRAVTSSLYELFSYTKYWELNERERGRM